MLFRSVLICRKFTTAGRTGKLCKCRAVSCCVNQLMTNWTLCLFSLCLVIDYCISTVGTDLGREFVSFYINNVPAGTGNLFLREDKIRSLNRVSTLRTFNNKFCHYSSHSGCVMQESRGRIKMQTCNQNNTPRVMLMIP